VPNFIFIGTTIELEYIKLIFLVSYFILSISKVDDCILDGEMVGWNAETNSYVWVQGFPLNSILKQGTYCSHTHHRFAEVYAQGVLHKVLVNFKKILVLYKIIIISYYSS